MHIPELAFRKHHRWLLLDTPQDQVLASKNGFFRPERQYSALGATPGTGEHVVWYHGDSGHKVTRSRRLERGRGQWKALLWTAVLLFLAYAAFKIIPAYVSNYELVDKMQEQARFAVVNRYSAEQVREAIYKTVQDLDIPATREQIRVEASARIVKISMDYNVPVDLMIYHTELHFTPSSENRSLW